MKSKSIYFGINIYDIKVISNNKNLFYKSKTVLQNHINKYKCKNYLYTFILGDNRYLDNSVKSNYQNLGVSHLFAISGMHITIISSFMLSILKKIKFNEEKRYILTSIFILFYLFLVSFTPSALRSGIFFILLLINKYFYFHIKINNILLLTISIILFNNPFIVYNTGFIFSASITYSLIIFSNLMNMKNNYFIKLFMTSLISSLISLPISLSNYFQFNLLTPFYNLVFVPLVSIIVFPIAILSIFLKFLDIPLYLLLKILEYISNFFIRINSLIYFYKPSFVLITVYYILIILVLKYHKKTFIFLLISLILFHYNINVLLPKSYILFIDVGQGDSILIHNKNKNILVDTGGKESLSESNYSIINSTTIPLLKSLGIRKLDYLILSHGDFDHMGDAINLVNNFKVEKVIFNCGPYNDLEKELIKVLDKKKIPYYSCIKELNIDNNKLYFLQTKEYDNENDNSNVIYTEINGYKFMFMGDAGIDKEKDILNKYNISNVDVLKVGHHGSKTSSSKELINSINPKYSIISVGKNNRYGHPNKEVLETLKDTKIYRTDQDGSIMFKIKNNELEMKICSP